VSNHGVQATAYNVLASGTPEQVFRYPNSAFVARFVGTGNVIAGRVERVDSAPAAGAFPARFVADHLTLDVVAEREGPMHAVIRPEDLVLSLVRHSDSARNHLDAEVTRLERLGPVTLVHLDVGRPLIVDVDPHQRTSRRLAAQAGHPALVVVDDHQGQSAVAADPARRLQDPAATDGVTRPDRRPWAQDEKPEE
jgi:ABC-type Fe3+/spermidine/putrescine transport system ATPase subunit